MTELPPLAAVEECFEVEAAMGQSFEHLDHWKHEGLDDCLAELRMPTRHDLVIDSDPNGLITKPNRTPRPSGQAQRRRDGEIVAAIRLRWPVDRRLASGA